jgi:hypothetical protein
LQQFFEEGEFLLHRFVFAALIVGCIMAIFPLLNRDADDSVVGAIGAWICTAT